MSDLNIVDRVFMGIFGTLTGATEIGLTVATKEVYEHAMCLINSADGGLTDKISICMRYASVELAILSGLTLAGYLTYEKFLKPAITGNVGENY
ncbi:MAG: hypothetical protein ABIJ20_01625 [Nanoarchaeota archaeon]|nr:hypothetical protein [Nanoarchaeota archaeon]MBU2475234.1 hypothetical protein [Nanoarchaeota archaeon]